MPNPAPARRPPTPAPKPAPPTPARAPAAAPTPKPVSKPASAGETAPGVMELKGLGEFAPPAPIADFLDARKTSTLNVRFGNLAQGPITVTTKGKGKYRVRKQSIPLSHPMFARVAETAPGLAPCLALNVEDQKLTGQVGLAAGEKVENLSGRLAKAPEMLGLFGFTITSLPTMINTLEGGSMHVGLKGVVINLGGAFSGEINFEAINERVTFDGNARVNAKGLLNSAIELKRATDGAITGKGTVGLTLPKNFSGNLDVAWDGTAITGLGKVGYKGEKFSGEVTLNLMERKQAEQLAEQKKAPEGAAPQPAAAKASAKKPAKIDYVVFGEGDLGFSFTEWLNGTAHVISDPKGNITVIGKITPRKEFILFEQKDYVRQLFKIEARASYGIPVVGNIFIFANVGMDLFAKLGPAKFYNIVIDGTYSTDPKVARNFSIRGSLNVSAGAGARLRGEAGAGLEVLAHDIKAGAGLNGIAGVKAYAETTPVVGYREKAAEGQDKKGEWFIRGDLEVAAQPFLGLSGDLFVEIDAPWWSPVPDKKWTWPLFGKEYPLGGSMGMLVSVDYVFGSGQYPKFDFKPMDFNSEKFMTDLYTDKAKSGGGKEAQQKGKWQEKNSAGSQAPSKTSPKGNAAPGKLAAASPAKSKRVAGKRGGKPVDPNAKTKEGKTVKQLQDEATKKGKKPASVDTKGGKGEPAKKDKGTEHHDEELRKGLAALDQVTARYAKDGATQEEVTTGVKAVHRKFKVFKRINVVDGGKTWNYVYAASPEGTTKGPEKPKGTSSTKEADTDSPVSIEYLKSIAKSLSDAWVEGGSERHFRNKAAGHVWIRLKNPTKEKPNFGATSFLRSGGGGANAFVAEVNSVLKDNNLKGGLRPPTGGLGGINFHTEAAVGNIARGIKSKNEAIVKRVDIKVFTFFEICDGCKSELEATTGAGGGKFKPGTRGAKFGIRFDKNYPPPGLVLRSNPNHAKAKELVDSAGGEKEWFKSFDIEP